MNDIEYLRSSGFTGFYLIRDLMEKGGTAVIPDAPGVYCVMRSNECEPVFLAIGTGGWFDGKDPNDPIEELESKWVSHETVLYVGKASVSLRKRLRAYMRFGRGEDANHHGGRHIWQLEDSRELLVCWKPVPGPGRPEELETEMIADFADKHEGKLPFANRRR
ncbi:MAG: hypothetical protein AB9860_01525 [Methanomassiliicoccales archaeon]